MSAYVYPLVNVWLQLGVEPPFNCVLVPSRGEGETAEVQVEGQWLPFPQSGPRPNITEWRGQTVVGMASDWGPARRVEIHQ